MGGGLGGGGTLGGGSLAAGSLAGRITPGDLGDNLARLAPTTTEQPTVPLRKRRPEGRDSAPESEAAAPKAPAGAPPAPAPRPPAVIEAWSPHFDDILPQRPSRSGRRRAR